MPGDVVECPWCGVKNEIEDILEYDDGETAEWQCELCNKWFYFDVSVRYLYDVENVRKEEQEED